MSMLKEIIKKTPPGRAIWPQLQAMRRRWNAMHWRFRRDIEAHMAARPLHLLEASGNPELAAFAREGVITLRAAHVREQAIQLGEGLRVLLERVRRGERPADWDVVAYPSDGIYRIRRIHETHPPSLALLKQPRVFALVNAYIGPAWRYTAYVDYKPDLVHDATTVPHCDTWKRQVKAFTFLSDVNEDNAPYVYWAGSHRDGEWRRRVDYLLWSNDYIGSGGNFAPHVLRDLVERGELREMQITGQAGDVIVTDTRGPHRASNLRAGYRLQLVEVFDSE